MKKYNVVITDFDGTLLSTKSTISDKAIKTIAEFRERGGLFFIATGRMYSGIMTQLSKAGLDKINLPIICYQGALVKNSITKEVLYDAPVAVKETIEVLEFAHKRGVYCQTYVNDEICVETATEFTKLYANAMELPFKATERLIDYVKQQQKPVHKVMLCIEKEKRESLERDMKKAFAGRLQIISASSHMVDAISLDAGKDKAAEVVGKLFGFTLDDCMACGDNLNDYTLVSRAGLGVAVENAVPALKEVAKVVTLSNDNDGVIEAMLKYCF